MRMSERSMGDVWLQDDDTKKNEESNRYSKITYNDAEGFYIVQENKPGPIYYFSMDDSETHIYDEIHGFDKPFNTIKGTLHNLETSKEGIKEQTYDWNADKKSYLKIPHKDIANIEEGQDFTINFWLKKGLDKKDNVNLISYRGKTAYLVLYSWAGQLIFGIEDDNGATCDVRLDRTHIENNEWRMITLVRDSSSLTCEGMLKIYVDGWEYSEKEHYHIDLAKGSMTFSSEFCIGARVSENGLCSGNYMTGSIDEFSYWKRKLEKEEIRYIYGEDLDMFKDNNEINTFNDKFTKSESGYYVSVLKPKFPYKWKYDSMLTSCIVNDKFIQHHGVEMHQELCETLPNRKYEVIENKNVCCYPVTSCEYYKREKYAWTYKGKCMTKKTCGSIPRSFYPDEEVFTVTECENKNEVCCTFAVG